MKRFLLSAVLILQTIFFQVNAQSCTPAGNEAVYGSGNIWIGYLYSNLNFTGYCGYTIEGSSASPDFNQSFLGNSVMFPTQGCAVQTETFSARYRLRKNFTNGVYNITVGGDDGYRLSLDGGTTWAINNWNAHSYVTTLYSITLSGNYDLVLEYYENSGENRLSFDISLSCSGAENTSVYGTDNSWIGYVYDGTGFNSYKGVISQGSASNPNFDQNFGGSNTLLATSGCGVQTETFSVRYRLQKSFAAGIYLFTVGGDDGFRLSLDGGTTWAIDRWSDQQYASASCSVSLNGTYNMVLEYYENGGDNRIRYTSQALIILPVHLISFSAKEENKKSLLEWRLSTDSDPADFVIEKSNDGFNFSSIGLVQHNSGQLQGIYHYTDANLSQGRSYYRLKMVNSAGQISFSNIVTLNFLMTSATTLSIYPTLVSNNTFFVRSVKQLKEANIQVFDISGKRRLSLAHQRLDAGQSMPLQLPPSLRSGVYIVRVTEHDGNITTQRILIE